jgi:polyketide synthase PksJ
MGTENDFKSLTDVLINSAKCEQGITFIESENDEDFLSYKELYQKAASVLDNLQQAGLKPGDEMLFQVKGSRDFLVLFWACLLGKIIPVPLTLANNEEYGLKVINVWKILKNPYLATFKKQQEWLQAYAANNQGLEFFKKIKERTFFIEDIEEAAGTGKIHSQGESDIAYIQFSSGSTGSPKGVILTHKNLLTYTQAFLNIIEHPERGIDRYFSWVPLTHDLGMVGFHLTPLIAGCHQAIMSPQLFIRNPDLWLKKMSSLKSTITTSPNFGYKHFLKHFDRLKNPDLDLSNIRLILNGAEPISPEVCDEFLNTLAPYGLRRKAMKPGYGMAETSLGVTLDKPDEEVKTVYLDRNSINRGQKVSLLADKLNAVPFVKVGTPLQINRVKIADEKGNTCEDNIIGEIMIKGDNVTPGYYNDREATRKTITPDGWLKTGDLGFFIDGQLVVTGRIKDIIFVNGQNYYPHDMERAAEELEGIDFEKAAFCGVYNPGLQTEEIVCFVVFRRSVKEFLPLAAALKNHLLEKMGIEISVMIPVKKIPKTTSGKIQRFKLKERYLQGEFDKVIKEFNSVREQMKPIKPDLSGSDLQEIIVDIYKDVLKLENISIYDNFFDLGGNSSAALRVKARLQDTLGKNIDDVTLFKYPTINMLKDYLSSYDTGEKPSGQQREHLEAFRRDRRSTWERIKKHLIKGDETRKEGKRSGLEIAIIGMAGRFPGAKNIHEFWENIKNGFESISFFSEEELSECGIDKQWLNDPNYVKAKGVLEDIDYFDAAFFDYSPLEAEKMDPQMRLFHECSWEALENAGYDPANYPGLIGVYVGASPNPQWESAAILSSSWRKSASTQFVHTQWIDKDFMTTRLSYALNLTGPSFSIYTACSTSLVAVDLACQGLLAGRCDMALAGGASIWLPQRSGYLYEEGMIFSNDGHNRTFAEQASGTVFSDGAGIVLLKRLEDALNDRDHIYALIIGSAINNDGRRKAGFTAPALEGQAEVIASALQVAEVEPESIGYLEAHGTATSLGDTIEIDALKLAFGTSKKRYCALGSVKANIGHLNTAAGAAGLVKTVLSLKHGLIPPTLNMGPLNPRIDFENSPFYINSQLKEWERNMHPRRAGVSSFGIGGTNSHVVLEEWPEFGGQGTDDRKQTAEDRGQSQGWEYQLILLSAKTESTLDKMGKNLAEYLKKNPGINLEDMSYTLQMGRQHFQYRKMLACSNVNEIIDRLSSTTSEEVYTYKTPKEDPTVVFLFPGQGSQYVNMGLGLYMTESIFRKEMDRLFAILKSLIDYDLKKILYPPSPTLTGSSSVEVSFHPSPGINQTEVAQPLLFMIEYALAKLLMRWGIPADAMIGHSIGEYVAACLAGVFSLEDALKLVALRGKLMQQTPTGAMLGVQLPENQVNELLPADLSLAAVNGNAKCVVSGPHEAIAAFKEKMIEKGILTRSLHTSHAFHSSMMEPILKEFETMFKRVSLHPPRPRYISNLTGTWIRDEEATNPRYWSDHLRQTVRFSDGIEALLEEKNPIFVEVGPGNVLGTLVQKIKQNKFRTGHPVVNLLRHPLEKVPDTRYLLNQLGRLWLFGKNLNWEALYPGETRYRIPLPTYPFAGQHFSIADNLPGVAHQTNFKTLTMGKTPDISDWFYIPGWKRSVIPRDAEVTAKSAVILLFMDGYGLGNKIGTRLTQEGYQVLAIRKGKAFVHINDSEYHINPSSASDYESLFNRLEMDGKLPHTIIHLWGVTPLSSEEFYINQVELELENGFYSLIALAQSLGKSNSTAHFQVKVVTNNMQDVVGGEAACPGKAALAGPVKIIPREYNNIACCMIDILLPPPAGKQEQELVEQLVQEFKIETREKVIAYRNHHRWIETFEPVEIGDPGDGPTRLREKGVYLISGGLGEIGLLVAEHLARHVKAKLILTGKSLFPGRSDWDNWLSTHSPDEKVSKRIRKIREFEALGAEVLPISVDVSKFNLMQQVITRAEERFGKINGVIHAAGIPDGAMIVRRTREMSEEILAPKITGTLVLEKLLKDTPLDFFILWSSLASILPLPGQTAYAGANAFLDAFAAAKTLNNGTPPISINWDRWRHVGFAVIIENEHKKLWGEELGSGIASSAGIDIFNRILSNPLPRYAVSTMDLRWAIKQDNFYRELSYTAVPDNKTLPNKMRPRPELSTAYVEAQNEIERKLVEAWKNFLGIDQVGIHDNFFELGTTSLEIFQFNNRLKTALDIDIPVAAMYSYPTVALLGKFIERKNPGERLIDSPQLAYEALDKGKEKIGMLRTKRRSINQQ